MANFNSSLTAAQIETALTGSFSNIVANSWTGNAIAAAYLPTATDTATGIVELATNAEALAGASTTLAVTPAGLAAALQGGLAVSSGYLNWQAVTSNTQMILNNGYIADLASLLTFTLPSTAAVGDRVAVTGKNTGGWRISQNAGQQIHFDDMSTASGIGGYLSSTFRYNCVELQCVIANSDWVVRSSVGDINVI